jgi:molybdopterin converting factor small subunit
MQVELRVFATLRKYLPDHPLDRGVVVTVEPGTTVGQLITKAGVPLEKVKIVMVNNRHADLDQQLVDGDRVAVFPPVAGG